MLLWAKTKPETMLDRYEAQVRLILSILPDIAAENVFALKGGTAINLFYRDMPRLSIDIDLTYLPIQGRDISLENIDRALERIMQAIARRHPHAQVQRIAGGGKNDTRILVRTNQVQVKIETSAVTRGAVYQPTMMAVSDAVTEHFGFAEMNVLAFEDLYGGKLHATLDRQHPRDLFDVKVLYENEGLTEDLFRVFMIYVASSGRPMHELLTPPARFKEELYDGEFMGMTREVVTKEALIATQTHLYADIQKHLSGDIATFLLTLHDAKPDFNLLGIPEAAALPAIRWKLLNLEKLKASNPEKHVSQRNALKMLFQ